MTPLGSDSRRRRSVIESFWLRAMSPWRLQKRVLPILRRRGASSTLQKLRKNGSTHSHQRCVLMLALGEGGTTEPKDTGQRYFRPEGASHGLVLRRFHRGCHRSLVIGEASSALQKLRRTGTTHSHQRCVLMLALGEGGTTEPKDTDQRYFRPEGVSHGLVLRRFHRGCHRSWSSGRQALRYKNSEEPAPHTHTKGVSSC